MAKALGIPQSDIAQKIRVHQYLYNINIDKSYSDIDKKLSILINSAFGLTHALQLTKLHHDKILYEDEDNGIKTQTKLAKALGISRTDITQKVQVHQYLYDVNIDNLDLDIDSKSSILTFNSFGLTHALQLTKLHHDKMIVEKREENDQTIKLTIEELLPKEKETAKKRQKAGIPSGNFPEGKKNSESGRAKAEAAKKVGWSRPTFEKAKEITDKAKEELLEIHPEVRMNIKSS